MLVITPQTAHDGIDVADLFPCAGEDRGVFQWRDGHRTLTRGVVEDGERTLAQFTLPGLRPLDRIRFTLGPGGLAEIERRDRRDGPNLLVHPLRLPARLVAGESVRTSAGGTVAVALGWVGVATLRLGTRETQRVVARLDATQGEVRRVQWLAAGAGEVAVGVAGQPLDRWIEAWSGPGGALLADVPRAWRTCALPGLPSGPSTAQAVDGIE